MDIKSIVSDIVNKNNSSAKSKIYEALHEKVNEQLEEKKMKIASSTFKKK